MLLSLWWTAAPALAGDWPMWRYDGTRSAASPDDLPANLQLAWVRQYAAREPVWDDPLNRDVMPYDQIFEPIIVGRRMIVGFNDRDKVVALDIDTGRELWTFYCDGPVRFPPAALGERIFVASDDGWLYALDAADGSVAWKFRGAPGPRKSIGNKRVISCWPARGGPVVCDGKVYFAASIWPFMGTFIYALDAATGRVDWVNDGTGATFMKQPHNADSFAGVAPQGALVATKDLVIVPGGRSLPAGFDRASGALRYFRFGAKGEGGSLVCADDRNLYVHTRLRGVQVCDLASGKQSKKELNEPVLTEGGTISFDGRQVVANADKFNFHVSVDGSGDLIRAGSRIYAAGKKDIVALDGAGQTVWSQPVKGKVLRLLGGADHLIAITLDGRIVVYAGVPGATLQPSQVGNTGALPQAPVTQVKPIVETPADVKPSPDAVARANELLKQCGASDGFALWFGVDDEPLLDAVLAQSQLHIIVVDADMKKVDTLRRRFDAAGLYGRRVVVQQGDPISYAAPPYFANLVVVGPSMAAACAKPETLAAVYESVRPYGGLLSLPPATKIADAKLASARVEQSAGGVLVHRDGPLVGAADWTHQYGNIANTVKSDDDRVRLPLGVLWFGGNSNLDVLPRHGHGPPEQVVGGRMFIEGMDCLSARDVYTGRVLWKRVLKDLDNFGVYFNETYKDAPLSTAYNQGHIAGANARGTNFVATADEIYVALGDHCEVLDAASGKTLRTITMPKGEKDEAPPLWGFIGVYQDVLLGGAGFANFTGGQRDLSTRQGLGLSDLSASDGLVAFDRHTGKILWQAKARYSFLHNSIVAGGGRVYCLDRLPGSVEGKLKRRAQIDPTKYRIVALDARTGQPAWQQEQNIFGTWLSYSEKNDLLLQAGSKNGDRLPDEVDHGMIAYRGRDGAVAWQDLERKYSGPCILHNDTILTNVASYKTTGGAFSLLTGKPSLVVNPLSGQGETWQITRTYGCNTAIASEHLLTFRSGAAGFYDLADQGGTGNFGGFKSSCTSNLIVAGGVLNAPDYTRTCTCTYQNQTSLALVHMPEIEVWTFGGRSHAAGGGQREGAERQLLSASLGHVLRQGPPLGSGLRGAQCRVGFDPTHVCGQLTRAAGRSGRAKAGQAPSQVGRHRRRHGRSHAHAAG
ncbi:MAG: PQQ-binding-like beta-propeller repeat protein [Planctomycetia bacterium]|nr:PQQ-binding-like beta-propeller repeat protein [Planctomycetia bacterium]